MTNSYTRRASYAQKQACRQLLTNELVTAAERAAESPMITTLSSQGADELLATYARRIRSRAA